MKQLRPVINRIVKKIPDKDMEKVLGYLLAEFPKEAAPELVPALISTMKREEEYVKKLMEAPEKDERENRRGTNLYPPLPEEPAPPM